MVFPKGRYPCQRANAAANTPLADNDEGIRRAAFGTWSDAQTIAAASARLEDSGEGRRRAAAAALGQIAKKGDAQTIAAVSAHLEDSDEGTRRASVAAVGEYGALFIATTAICGESPWQPGKLRAVTHTVYQMESTCHTARR